MLVTERPWLRRGGWIAAFAWQQLLLLLAACMMPAPASAQPLEHLRIYVPASSDGGWAHTAVAVRRTLLVEGLVRKCDIVYSPGAGGLIGLVEFVEAEKGNAASVMLGGRSLLSAPLHNRSQLSLANVVPVARLTGTDIVIAVSRGSPIRDLDALFRAVRNDAAGVHWIGGSEGGVDHLLIMGITQALGGNRERISFEAVPGGGKEELKRLESEPRSAMVGSYEEFARFAQEGNLRIIGVSAPRRNPLIATAPTLAEGGVPIPDGDWRGIFAPPGLADEQVRRLADLFEKMVRTASWKEELQVYGWQDRFLKRPQFSAALDAEGSSIRSFLAHRASPSSRPRRFLDRAFWVAVGAVALALILTMLAFFMRRKAMASAADRVSALPSESMAEAAREADKINADAAEVVSRIDSEFEQWKLSSAEKEIGWMLLKGLSFRFIAEARGTTERTVREQARSIYAKSGLENRSVFAAYFLEDFVFVAPSSAGDANRIKTAA